MREEEEEEEEEEEGGGVVNQPIIHHHPASPLPPLINQTNKPVFPVGYPRGMPPQL